MAHIAVGAGFDVVLADLVLEITTTTGTGTYQLSGVPSEAEVEGVRTFVTGVGNGNRTVYVARLGTSWEVGVGLVSTGSPNTLTRDHIIASTNSNNAVSWSAGIKTIACVPSAALLNQIVDPARVTDIEDRAAFKDEANTFTEIQTIDLDSDDVHAVKLLNAAGIEVVRLRVGSGGEGIVHVRNTDNLTTGVFSANVNDRGSLKLNEFEVYPLEEGRSASQATTSGTIVDFEVRSDAQRITIMFDAVSCSSGAFHLGVRLAGSGGFETTTYSSASVQAVDGGDTVGTSATAFFVIRRGDGESFRGTMVLERMSATKWCETHVGSSVGAEDSIHGGGIKTITGDITEVRVLAPSGTFSSGSVVVRVE